MRAAQKHLPQVHRNAWQRPSRRPNVDKLSVELAVAVPRLEQAWLQVDQASDGAWQAQARAAIALARATAGQSPT